MTLKLEIGLMSFKDSDLPICRDLKFKNDDASKLAYRLHFRV